MAAKSGSELEAPLLDRSSSPPPSSNGAAARKITAWMLRALMWIVFLAWILVLLAFPKIKLGPGSSSSQSLGTGIVLLLFAAPVLSLALLATIYLEIRIKPVSTTKKSQPAISLWTCPCLVDGLLGVVSAAEVLLIVAFVGYLVWCLTIYVINDSDLVQRFMKFPAIREKFLPWELWTYVIGLRFGFLGLFCLGFLLLPVARGSPLLRLIDIPFEHAVKYHVWLGHLTMAIFTIHGLCYVVVWTVQGRLEELLAWQRIGVANLPGEISLVAGLLLWMTSFGYIRQAFFELFFYTHQLYVVFFVFMAFHIGDLSFCISMAGFFLFMLDRFLRFCQSRRSVDLLVSRVLPCGTIEVALSKPQDLNYNALSFIFLSFPKISFLQWHPFSVSSSPYDARDNMSFLIKPLGSWTGELQKLIKESTNKRNACPVLGVEGPYGHESDYYLKYEALVLVAGGIGVSPFIAILRDILHRYNMNHGNLPKEVTLIWAVKYSKELGIINLVQPEFIFPDYASRLKLTIQAFVTREIQPDIEEATPLPEHILSFAKKPDSKPVSTLVGTYSNLWMGVYIAVSTAGFFLTQTIMEKFFLGPMTVPTEGGSSGGSVSWTVRAAALLLSMTCGVVVVGGLAIALWDWIERSRKGRKSGCQESIIGATGAGDKVGVAGCQQHSLVGPWNTVYGNRPELKEIFAGFTKKWSGINVGVLVCGPSTLQTSVAEECRANNLKFGSVAFHYHSVSFDL
ncbi:ferric reduction oxidase 6 [Selaginella moellendorffii]|nr:ferric reduction oxidase 6 [Selaginella moellendorffii]|eukprot:XP_002989049.2 ferric reduction oxidase 6 [Selaginella moellendorffii]